MPPSATAPGRCLEPVAWIEPADIAVLVREGRPTAARFRDRGHLFGSAMLLDEGCSLRNLRHCRWQLKDRRLLSFHQVRQQHDLAVRKLQGIVVDMRAVLIELTENSGLVGIIFLLHGHARDRLTSHANDSSVPGSTQTATLTSSGAAKPDVPELNRRVTSLSPTLAGRVLTF